MKCYCFGDLVVFVHHCDRFSHSGDRLLNEKVEQFGYIVGDLLRCIGVICIGITFRFCLDQSLKGILCREEGSNVVIHGENINDLSVLIADIECAGL